MKAISVPFAIVAVSAGMWAGGSAADAAKHRHPSPTQRAIRDCASDGRLDHRYSLATLQRALRHIPADIAEYTNCPTVLRRAELKAAARGRPKRHRTARR